ncbi:MAG: hypothetical protein VXZ73_04345, partial [Pseudomonadota bacterium]|nr:hypothetical protein [Pseudomonadota bacterium]
AALEEAKGAQAELQSQLEAAQKSALVERNRDLVGTVDQKISKGAIGGESWADSFGSVGDDRGGENLSPEQSYINDLKNKSLKNGFFPITAWKNIDNQQRYKKLKDEFKKAQKNKILREDYDHITKKCGIQLRGFDDWKISLESMKKNSTSSNGNYAIQIENNTTLHCNNQDKIHKVSTSWATNDMEAAKEAGKKAMQWYLATHSSPDQIKRWQRGITIPITSDNQHFIDAAKAEGQRLLKEKFPNYNLGQAEVFTTRLTKPNKNQGQKQSKLNVHNNKVSRGGGQ